MQELLKGVSDVSFVCDLNIVELKNSPEKKLQVFLPIEFLYIEGFIIYG